MRISALALRIIQQFIQDKRSLALMFVAPILILSLLSLVFNSDPLKPNIGLVNMPTQLSQVLSHTADATTQSFTNKADAQTALKNRDLDAYIVIEKGQLSLHLEGSDPTVTQAVMQWLQKSLATLPEQQSNIVNHFLHGSPDMSTFDSFGPVLVGFFAFFFVFLLSGVSFLRERTGGTLERLVCSPMKLWEIIIGYVLGFGLFTLIQSLIISAYSIYILKLMMMGSFLLVLLITLLLSLTALTLGILLSAFANNELQMMQFIPIIIVPSVFFSGLFNLEAMSKWISWIGQLTPLYYAADALRDIMIRGSGWHEILMPALVLIAFSLLFMLLNLLALRKLRKG